ncbi:hypothetical protein ED733_005266 [Metarhizium rileyi]|uniref:RBR-type E3 ubiquitin transferase n=1 Tax=Metarhizium rileyi (strain RCEF 4871) TaxID=1649241 RepID=A0A5C6G9E6_METRR|nr:hypothetical protein ED733_005266 [Metarhizium rileyi]
MFDPSYQASLDLVFELQLQDARTLIQGKHKMGETPDAQLAAELHQLELESLASFHNDQAISRSMAEEEPGTAGPDGAVDDDTMERLAALYVGNDGHAGTGSSGTAVASSSRVTEKRSCAACMTDVPYHEAVECPCSHEYCRACMAALLQAAINDESLFPPRCCNQPIPLDLNRSLFPPGLVGRYEAKKLEYATENRTYCHRAGCSAFIPKPFIQDDIAPCVECQSTTCAICKGPYHGGDCPEDVATMELLRVAEENGWQRCYSCRRMVDLELGCNHIICRCGAQFCYVCGEPWKTCPCERWDEDRLIDRANDVVDRDAHEEGLQVQGHDRETLVECTRQDLEADHWGHFWTPRTEPIATK